MLNNQPLDLWLVRRQASAKVELAKALAAFVPQALQAHGFKTHRPQKKRAGSFPTRYYRDFDDVYAQIEFVWRKNGHPMCIIEVVQIKNKEHLRTLRALGSPPYDRDVGGKFSMYRISRSKSWCANGESWFGISILALALKTDHRSRINAEAEIVKIRIQQIQRFMATGLRFNEMSVLVED